MRKASATCLFTLVLSGCVHTPLASDDVYRTPSRFVGQTVQACGYMIDSSNIVESQDRDDEKHRGGLSIAAKGPLNLRHRGPVCVEGDVIYMGCGTRLVICIDTAFEYGIRVRRVIR